MYPVKSPPKHKKLPRSEHLIITLDAIAPGSFIVPINANQARRARQAVTVALPRRLSAREYVQIRLTWTPEPAVSPRNHLLHGNELPRGDSCMKVPVRRREATVETAI